MSIIHVGRVFAYRGELSSSARLTALALADGASDDPDTFGECFPSLKHIASKTSLSVPTIRKHLSALAADGLIVVTPRYREDNSRTSNTYTMAFPPESGNKGAYSETGVPPTSQQQGGPTRKHKGGPTRKQEDYEPSEEPSDEPNDSLAPQKRRKVKDTATSNGKLNGRDVWAAWVDVWQARGDPAPTPTGPATAAAKNIAKFFRDAQHASETLTRYREDDDRFLDTNGWALQHIISRIDRYIHENAPEPEDHDYYREV